MSSQGWNTSQTKKPLERVLLEDSPKIIIDEKVLAKIKYLCMTTPKLEWSGVMFYTVEGTIIDTANMVIRVQEVLLMDIGTKGYTEYNWDEAVVAYQMDHMEALDWNKGHIHSHNDMNVFFSGEDWGELNDNSPNHNVYVSLIVNNWMEMTAKVAFVGQKQVEHQPTINYTCKDENGDEYTLPLVAGKPVELPPTMFVYNCDIVKPEEKVVVDNEFAQRVEVIKKEKEEAAKKKAAEAAKRAAATPPVSGASKDYNNNSMRFLPNTTPNKQYQPSSNIPDWNGQSAHSQPLQDAFDDEKYQPLASTETYKYDSFLAYVLNMGNETKAKALTVAGDMKKADIPKVVEAITTSFTAYYDRWFEKIKGFGTLDHFDDVVDDIRANMLAMPWEMDEILDALDEVDELVQKSFTMATMTANAND